jgi:arabinofuranan 3-O-arabinosyltransferase
VVRLAPGIHTIEAESTAQFAVDSVVLEPVGADAAGAAVPVDIHRWEATSREVSFGSSTTPRVLETTENANPGWLATLDGQELTPVRVDGWRQGWLVPAGPGGTVTLEFAPQRTYLAGLGAGLAAAILLIVLAFGWPRREKRWDAPPTLQGRGLAMAIAGFAAALLIGGAPGLGVAAVAVASAWLISRRFRSASAWIAFACAAGAALGAAAMPWPGRLDAPDALLVATALLAVAALAAACAPTASRDEPTAATAPPG